MSLQKVLVISHVRRHISSNIVNYHNNHFKREGKFMKKMIYGEIPRKKWHPAKDGRSAQIVTPAVTNLTSPHVTRRATVLNKLFMKHITDLMATGEISSEILGRGIEVSRVNVTNCFKLIKVFWFSSTCNADELDEITVTLDECAYKLRHELSQLKVIGVVPPIQFFKDHQLANSIEFERTLAAADYGDDYAPAIKVSPQSHITLVTTIPDEVREKILNLEPHEKLEDENDERYNVDLPPMRHDVLGLDHWRIMSRLKLSLKKNEETVINRMNNPSTIETQRPFISAAFDALRSKEETDAFNAFLLRRRVAEKKRKKSRGELDLYFQIDKPSSGDSNRYQDEADADDMTDADIDNDTTNWRL